MDHRQLTIDLKEKIIKIIKKWIKLPHFKIFVFGSRVEGNASERSDIDIGIDAKEEISGAAKVEMEAELADLPILQKIDVVDFNSVSDDFKKVALQNVEVIYEQ